MSIYTLLDEAYEILCRDDYCGTDPFEFEIAVERSKNVMREIAGAPSSTRSVRVQPAASDDEPS